MPRLRMVTLWQIGLQVKTTHDRIRYFELKRSEEVSESLEHFAREECHEVIGTLNNHTQDKQF